VKQTGLRQMSKLLSKREVMGWVVLGGVLLSFFLWQSNHLSFFGRLHDEGEYLMIGRLMHSGYELYLEIFAVTPPFYLECLNMAFSMFGLSVTVARVLTVSYGVLGVMVTALIGKEAGGWSSGIATAIFLMLNPEFYWLSRVAMPDVPAASLAALSVLLVLYYVKSGKRLWLALSGLVGSASLLSKLTSAYLVLLLPAVILMTGFGQRSKGNKVKRTLRQLDLLIALAVLALSLALPIILSLFVYDTQSIYRETVGFHLLARQFFPLNLRVNVGKVLSYCLRIGGFFGLALCGGLLSLAKRDRPVGLVSIVWVSLVVIQSFFQAPLREHYMLALNLPSAVLAAIVVSEACRGKSGLARPISVKRILALVLVTALGVAFLLQLPGAIEQSQRLTLYPLTIEAMETIDLIKTFAEPNDFVITDKEILAFLAERNIPPPLGGTSHRRIDVGWLTGEQLIEITQRYEVPVVVLWAQRLRRLQGYEEWLRDNYQLVRFYKPECQVYLRLGLPLPPEYVFDDRIILVGAKLDGSRIATEGKIGLILCWQALRDIDDCVVSLELVNKANHIWGQEEGGAYWGGLPIKSWEKGQFVKDERYLEIWPGTPPGEYWIKVVWRDLARQQTLETGSGDPLLLGPFRIEKLGTLSRTELDIEHPLEVDLGDKVRLLGYNIESGFRPGDGIHLTLFWQCLEEMEQDYTVFTHLIDEKQNIWGQKDNQPVDGFYPTSQWEVGEIVRDQYDIAISPEALPGEYQLEVGMYLAETGERLSVFKGDQEIDNKVLLIPEITVE